MNQNNILSKKIEEYLIFHAGKVKINTNDIIKNDVFVALKGNTTHGSRYISQAINRGAKYIITDQKIKKNYKDKIILIVEDVMIFLLSIANYKRILFKGKVIGITGSIGKTTLKENLKYFISQTSKVSASIKSYNNYLGVIISLINMNLSSKFVVFEIGTNNFDEVKNLTSIVLPSQTIITNILPVHLQNLKNTRNIALEKSAIFNPKYNSNIELIILPQSNVDEKFITKLAVKQKISNILTFGKGIKQDYYLKNIKKINDSFFEILVCSKDRSYKFQISKNQLPRIDNILISLIICEYNKLDINNFLNSTKKIKLIEGRGLESKIIINSKLINFIDESYNASPNTMMMCIKYFSKIMTKNSQKKYLILGDMKELGKNEIDFHVKILKQIISLDLENVVICGELMNSALNKIQKINQKIVFMLNEKLILKYLKETLNHNDILLIKGSNSSLTKTISRVLLKKGEY